MKQEPILLQENLCLTFLWLDNFLMMRKSKYYQIHVDVLYIPTEENKDFQRTIWNEDIEEDIFSYIKKTPEFNFCKDKVFSKIEIYLDEI